MVRFDPDTQLVRSLEAMRFKTAGKILWINEARAWGELGGQLSMTLGTVTWLDDGKPWAVFNVEEIVLNANVTTSLSGASK